MDEMLTLTAKPLSRIYKRRLKLLGLLLVIALGAVLRLHHLGFQSLWEDELYSGWASEFSELSDVIQTGVEPDIHPPGYQVLLYVVEQWLGYSEVVLRLPGMARQILFSERGDRIPHPQAIHTTFLTYLYHLFNKQWQQTYVAGFAVAFTLLGHLCAIWRKKPQQLD